MSEKVIVVGASAAGLAVARCLEEAGATPLVLEASDSVGSMWRNAYERLHLHTSRRRSGLPFMPMPANYPRYPSRTQMVDYLVAYAAALKSPPRFGERVTTIERSGEGWRVTTATGSNTAGNVVVATGNTRAADSPVWPGMDSYSGRVLHSSAYRTGADFRGQGVLVVGFGNSACEIAIDLAEQGASPALAVRSAVNVIPRELLGIPITSFGLISQIFPPRVADAINAPALALAVGDIRPLGLTPLPYGPIQQIVHHRRIPLIDIGTLKLIREGRIAVRPGIDHFASGTIAFADGREETYDAVILATGFRAALHDLLPSAEGVLDADDTPLASGAPTAAPGLYFCGFDVTPGGMLYRISQEARALARVIGKR